MTVPRGKRSVARARSAVAKAISLVAVAAVLSAALPLLGCSGGPDTVINKPTTIAFWHTQKGAGAKLLADLVAEFSKNLPSVTIDLVYRGDSPDLAADLAAAVAAGEGPILAEVPEEALPELRNGGTIIPLGQYISSRHYGLGVEDLDDFWPCFVQANTLGRQVWGLPFSHKVYALSYDPAKLGPSQVPATWEELAATASELTSRNSDPAQSVFGLAVRPGADLFTLFLYQNGGQLLTGDPPRPVFDSPQGTGCLEFLAELTVLRRAAVLAMGDPAETVAGGRAVMAIGPVGWPAGEPAGGAGIALAPLPSGLTGATLSPGTSLVICAQSSPAQAEAAWRLARWLTRTDTAARWCAATGDVPVRRSSMDDPSWLDGPGRIRGFRAVVQQLDVAVVIPGSVQLETARKELDSAVTPYLLGQISSSQSLLDGVAEKVLRAGP